MDLENCQPPKDIFILSGQSNMVGLGGVDKNHHFDGVIPPECRPDPCILRLDPHLDWELAKDPLHYDIDTRETCGVGPGMAFANAVKLLFATVGLVPCAVGGTAIKEWARGGTLYENMVKRAKFAAAAESGDIRALLWYQGESDTGSRQDAESYKDNMEKLIENVRSDLSLPSLPIIQVAIATGSPRYIETVREAQKSIDKPNVVCVDAKGLPLKSDYIHLTTEAQVQLGLKLADAYINHFAPPQQPSN